MTRDGLAQGLAALLQGVLAVLVVVLAVDLGRIWIARAGYPYDLEWMEGGMLVHSWRLLEGRPVHTAPSLDWIPYLYPTGYSSLVALLAKPLGLSMTLGRLVSLAGTLAAAAAIPAIVRRVGGDGWAGAVGAAVFLATYPFSGAFMDLVRLDGLMMGLFAWSLVCLVDGRRGTLVASALLLCAAYLVKHNVAAFGFAYAAAVWHRDGWRSALRFGLWSALPALAVTAYLQWTTGGHYLTWLVAVPSTHGFAGNRIFPGIGLDHGHALPFVGPLAAAALAGVVARGRRVPASPYAVGVVVLLAVAAAGVAIGGRGDWAAPRARVGLWVAAVVLVALAGALATARTEAGVGRVLGVGLALAVIAAMALGVLVPGEPGLFPKRAWTLASGFGTVTVGGGAALAVLLGVLRPSSWRVTLGVGVAVVGVLVSLLMRGHVGGFVNVNMPVHWIAAVGGAWALGAPIRAIPAGSRMVWTIVASALLAAQLAWSRSHLSVDDLVPTPEDVAAGDALVERLAKEEGPVLSPFNPWLLVLAGHDEPGWHLIALWDIDRRDGPYHQTADEVRAALAGGEHWRAVLDGARSMNYRIHEGFERAEVLVRGRGVFMPKTGYRNRPQTLRTRGRQAR